MNKPLSEKEKLLSMLTGIYDQLEELELVLEASFSDLRTNLNLDEINKIIIPEQRLSMIENEIFNLDLISMEQVSDSKPCLASRTLKLELGY